MSSTCSAIHFSSRRLSGSVHSELGVQILLRAVLQTQLGGLCLRHHSDIFVRRFSVLLHLEVSPIPHRMFPPFEINGPSSWIFGTAATTCFLLVKILQCMQFNPEFFLSFVLFFIFLLFYLYLQQILFGAESWWRTTGSYGARSEFPPQTVPSPATLIYSHGALPSH